jgi:hypothetical protein
MSTAGGHADHGQKRPFDIVVTGGLPQTGRRPQKKQMPVVNNAHPVA